MKGKVVYILLCLLLAACSAEPEIEKTIHECPAPPEGRASAICFALGDTIYVVSGRGQDGKYRSTMMSYSTASGQWTNNINTPLEARVNGVVCCTSKAAYLGLGFNGGSIYRNESYCKDWWCFKPSEHQWKRLADFPSDKTVSAVAFGDEDNIWVGFGFNGFGDELWCYSIAEDRWEAIAHQETWPKRLMAPVATACNGHFYQGTGFRRYEYSDWWEFFPSDNHWEPHASIPGKGRHNSTCAATSKSIWVIGGWHYGDSLTTGFHFEDIQRYSPQDDHWTRCGTIPCGVTENGAACAVGNRVYFGLGENDKSEIHPHWYYIED